MKLCDISIALECFGWTVSGGIVTPRPLTEDHIRSFLAPLVVVGQGAPSVTCEGLLTDLSEYVTFFERKPLSVNTTIAATKPVAEKVAVSAMDEAP
jgi:hypothetical protein